MSDDEFSDELSDEDNDREYESGPFCVHWDSEPWACVERCARPGCGHPCKGHNHGACEVEGCECETPIAAVEA